MRMRLPEMEVNNRQMNAAQWRHGTLHTLQCVLYWRVRDERWMERLGRIKCGRWKPDVGVWVCGLCAGVCVCVLVRTHWILAELGQM